MRTLSSLPFLFPLLLFGIRLPAQMPVGSDTLYGNEWIKSGRAYWKVPVAADGLYRLTYEELLNAGVPADQVSGDRWQLFVFGKEVPLRVGQNGAWGPGEAIHFHGERNRMQLDRFYYDSEADILNPEYSLVTDTTWYFLTMAEPGEPTLRYQPTGGTPDPTAPVEPWFIQRRVQVNSGTHHQFNISGIAESVLTRGQGFAGAASANQAVTVDLPGLASVPEPTRMEVRLLASNTAHELQVVWNTDTVYRESFSGWDIRQVAAERRSDSLTGPQSIRVMGLASSSDRHAVSVITAWYPRQFQVGSTPYLEVTLPEGNGDRTLAFTGMGAAGHRMYCPSTGAMLDPLAQGDTLRFLVPEILADQRWVLADTGKAIPWTVILPAAASIPAIPAGSFLMISHSGLQEGSDDPVGDYAAYRGTEEGGAFPVVNLDIRELYDLFSYGIPRHPLAIRNLIQWLVADGRAPSHVFLVGKARQYSDTRTKAQLENAANASYFLPVFGVPGSVNLLATPRGERQVAVSIGQLPAATAGEVRMYLDKVVEHEAGLASTDPAERRWRKEAIHLSGGRTQAEQDAIRGYLLDMGYLFTVSATGGNVTTFYKTSSDPVEYSISQDLTRRIREGASIITLFGHSGAERFDFNVEQPSKLENQGRYPLFLSLGCGVGQTHTGLRGISEQFVFQPSMGALAFIGTASVSYSNSLGQSAFEFYRRNGQEGYGAPIGTNLRGALNLMQSYNGQAYRLIHQQLTLNGDPALRLHAAHEADYRVVPGSVAVQPSGLTTKDDTLRVSFAVENLGRNVRDTVAVRITHLLPDGQEGDQENRLAYFDQLERSLEATLTLPGGSAEGENRIRIEIDPEGLLTQGPIPSARDNDLYRHGDGRVGYPVNILSNTAYPSWPEDLGIVGASPVELRAFTADLQATLQDYIMQLDTSPWFDSALRRDTLLRQRGGILRWAPDMAWPDSTVWYWRVKPVEGDAPWRAHSFLYLDGSSEGWNQSHPMQFAGNTFERMTLDTTMQALRYINDVRTVRVRNGVYPLQSVGVDVDNDTYHFIVWDGPVNQGVYLFVFDPLTGKPWLNTYPGRFGSRQPTPWLNTTGHFPYWTNTPEWRKRAIDFLRDTVPSGHYVLLYTIQYENTSYKPETWAIDSVAYGTNLFQVLEAQGAQLIRSTETIGPRPYAFMYRKDDPSWPPMERMVELDQPLEETMVIQGIWNEGDMRSVPIGPAIRWEALHLAIDGAEPWDSVRFDLWGIDGNGQRLPLLQDVTEAETDLSGIDPNLFPFLELAFHSRDSLRHTCPQVGHWRILYEGLPDPALDPSRSNVYFSDTLLQGAPLRWSIPVVNLKDQPSDSFAVQMIWSDTKGALAEQARTFDGLGSNESLPLEWNWQQDEALGDHELYVRIDPDRHLQEADRRNNASRFHARWVPDDRPPLLDVTFDGERIQHGQLVSAQTRIAVTLRDDNPWLRLNDPAGIAIGLTRPGQSQEQPVIYDGERAVFLPAADSSGQPNAAQATYRPVLDADGIYHLTVRGTDRAGNESLPPYEIAFRVETEESVTHFWASPNPLGAQGAFRYRKTGGDATEDYQVKIRDMVGRTVLVLGGAELGPLVPGEHVTRTWDTSRLPSGMYHYELVPMQEAFRTQEVSYGPPGLDGGMSPVFIIP